MLDDHRFLKAAEHLCCGQSVLGQLVVSVLGNAYLAGPDQLAHSLHELGQFAFLHPVSKFDLTGSRC